MNKKIVGILACALMITTFIFPVSGVKTTNTARVSTPTMINDALIPSYDFNQLITQNTGPYPGFYDTSEYMMGSVAVGVILPESVGGSSTEDWTTTEENQVQNEITAALNWWKAQDANAGITFSYDWNFAISTTTEPISGPSIFSDPNWEDTWVSDVMNSMGYTSGNSFTRVWNYINNIRTSKGTDWAFAVFVVDSSNDLDGCFSDASPPTYLPCAWAYLGGPWIVMTYDNGKVSSGGWGIARMDQVMAHETGHIFYATDEYNGNTEYSGYLNAADTEWSGCIMHNNNLCVSGGTKKQIGWQDADMDNIHDILDTEPQTTINAYSPDPTSQTTLTYTGSSTVQPYTNNNPNGPGNDVTINTISKVEYRVNGGSWTDATASDGTFDEAIEAYTMTIGPLTPGTYTIDARAKNSVNNYDSTPCSDTVTISSNSNPLTPSTPSGPTTGTIGVSYTYTTSTTDPDNDQVKYGWDGQNDGIADFWTGFYASGAICTVNIQFSGAGTYQLCVQAEDTNAAQSSFSTPLTVTITGTNQAPNTPSTPSGPSNGNTGVTYTYTTSAIDPDGDTVKYGWDWDGDYAVDQWDDNGGSYYTSGATISTSHSWTTAGTYNVRVVAEDINGAQSGFSSSKTVVISSGGNNQPNKPSRPSGKTNGKTGTSYQYSTSATDPDGDKVKYGWDKDGDGTVDIWDDNGGSYYTSGATISTSLSWSSQGTYSLKVIAEDINGAQSVWSDPLTVQMPRNRIITTPFLNFIQNILDNLPNLFPILQHLLQLLGL